MGIELLEIGVKMRKGLIFTIRGFFKFICNHPFVVVMLCFLLFLQRWFPFIFSLLVSASPVFICTALLLGTLLSFGQPNIPEIEIEEKTFHGSVSLKTGVSVDTTVIEENDKYYVDRYNEKKRDEKEQLNEQSSEVHRGYSSDDSASFIEEKSHETNFEKNEFWEENRELSDNRYKQKAEWNDERLSDGEVLENHYASIPKVNKEHFETDDERSVDSFDSERVNVDTLDSPPRSPWKRVEEREEKVENEEQVNNALDSESDGGESSSPDASMADIMPMLDELHPLLDEEAPQNAHMSIDGSAESSSELSSISSLSSHEESDEETENQEDDLEVEEDENEDGEDEDEEEEQGDKEEETKSAITWTEEDQKNLMDLGSSELERNQRLENLILRRRGRKYTSMVPEINLIDLEISDHPYNIAPILTTRQNPFDVPQDSYNNSGLPPIPGSAPSILLQRRNPFDIPYDSSEEKPNLMGDGIQEDFTTVQSSQPFFRRHESFNVGPSIFAPSNRQDVKMRPYFVPERMVSEESSYSPFLRQSSELSDSKVSSVPETESIGSVEDLEDRKLIDEDSPLELEAIIPSINEVVTEEGGTSANPEPVPKKEEEEEEEEVTEEDLPNETESIVSEDVGHGSQSSEEDEEEKSNIEVDELEFGLGDVESYYEEGNAAMETEATGYSTDSSSSSLSEVSERVFTEGEGSAVLERGREQGLSTQTSVESLDLRITNAVVDDIKEPVYDSSPPAVRKNLSSSSISSDVHVESDLNLPPPVFAKRTVSFIERESEGSSSIEMLPGSSTLDPVDKHESRPNDVVNTREHDNVVEQHTQEDVPTSISDQNTQGNAILNSDDKLMHESTSNHLNEVQAQNSQAESLNEVQTVQESNMPEVQELDHDNLSNANSPLSPDFISIPSIVSESASPHVDMQTIVEEADEMSVGDFSVKGSVSNELEKHVDFVEGSSFSAHDAETSTNREEQVSDSRNSREEIDIYEDEKLQSSEKCTAEHIDISKSEFNERDGQDSPDQILSEEDTPSKKNETSSVVNCNFDDNNNGIPEIEENYSVEVDSLSKKAQVELVTKETITRNTDDDKLQQTQDILEVRFIEDATLGNEQVKINQVESSRENESAAKGTGIVAAEKLDDKAEAHENLHSTKSGKGKGKGKGKNSKSSSSSSSSESSSSDSEKE